MKKVSKKIFLGNVLLVLLAAVLYILCRSEGGYVQWEKEHSGIPDVVSSRTNGDQCMLNVGANTDRIEDEQAFAEETIRKYEENSFYTTKFSRDRKSLPRQVYMSVYLKRSDIGQGEAVFLIEYDADSGEFKIAE